MPYDAPAKPRLPFKFSTISRSRTVGDDWPEWQRSLFPVTYVSSETVVREKMAEIDREIGISRRCVAWALKQGSTSVVQGHRRSLDRLLRFRRNCETQIRMIENTRRIKYRAGLPPVLEVVGGTDAARQLIAAE